MFRGRVKGLSCSMGLDLFQQFGLADRHIPPGTRRERTVVDES